MSCIFALWPIFITKYIRFGILAGHFLVCDFILHISFVWHLISQIQKEQRFDQKGLRQAGNKS